MQQAAAARISGPAAPVIVLEDVSVKLRDSPRPPLRGLGWTVRAGERWAVIGANGAGKTTLLQVLTGALAPSTGELTILDGTPGAGGLRDPRLRTGVLDGLPATFAGRLTALEVVTLQSSGPAAMIGARPSAERIDEAHELLALFDCAALQHRAYAACSQGERQRILLARALMRRPELLLLDEPITGLDLPGRERLLQSLVRLAHRRPEQATIMVTHHLEELPPTTTHALLLRDGEMLASGAARQVITSELVSDCLGVAVDVSSVDGRWAARAHGR